MQKIFKLTDQQMCTYEGYQWVIGITVKETCDSGLCAPHCLHAYLHELHATLFNPIHAKIKNPRLFEGLGVVAIDDGTKLGCTEITLTRELELPVISTAARVHWAILCSLEVEQPDRYKKWAGSWLDGSDRSAEAARAAAWAAAWAAREAAWAAARAATGAAGAATGAARAATGAAEVAWAAGAGHSIDLVALAEQAIREEAAYEQTRADTTQAKTTGE